MSLMSFYQRLKCIIKKLDLSFHRPMILIRLKLLISPGIPFFLLRLKSCIKNQPFSVDFFPFFVTAIYLYSNLTRVWVKSWFGASRLSFIDIFVIIVNCITNFMLFDATATWVIAKSAGLYLSSKRWNIIQ